MNHFGGRSISRKIKVLEQQQHYPRESSIPDLWLCPLPLKSENCNSVSKAPNARHSIDAVTATFDLTLVVQ